MFQKQVKLVNNNAQEMYQRIEEEISTGLEDNYKVIQKTCKLTQ